MHGLAEQCQHDQHAEVADKLQRQRRGDGSVDDDLVRERDLAYQAAVSGDADRSTLQGFLRREPGPQRDRDEDQKALTVHWPGAKYGREDEVVDGKQCQRMQQRPRKTADASEIARKKLASKEIGEQRPMPREARGGRSFSTRR